MLLLYKYMEKMSDINSELVSEFEELSYDVKRVPSKDYEIEIIKNFDDLNLKDNLLRGIYSNGFEKPSVIQQRAIKPMLEGYDIVAQSQSGTGKTGTFSISALQLLDENLKSCQALIIVNTRELADQVNNVITKLSIHLKDKNERKIKTTLCVGGSDVQENKKNLVGAQIVVGTPGRIIDMHERTWLKTDDLKLLILDEADELLSTGFLPQFQTLISIIPETSQVCLFSATLPENV